MFLLVIDITLYIILFRIEIYTYIPNIGNDETNDESESKIPVPKGSVYRRSSKDKLYF